MPLTRVNIESPISASYIHDRYDLALRGRVASSQPIEAVELRLSGELVGQMIYGQTDPTVLPDGTIAFQYAFHLNLNLPVHRAQPHSKIDCAIAVRAVDNSIYVEPFEFAADPENPTSLAIITGPTKAPISTANVRPPILFYIEQSVVDDHGHFRIQGWATALDSPVTIQLVVGNELIATTAPNSRRDDVAQAFRDYPYAPISGFSLEGALDRPSDPPSAVLLRATAADGSSHEIMHPVERVHDLWMEQSLSADEPRRHIRYSCDSVVYDPIGGLVVIGWAFCDIGITGVLVHVDDEYVGDAELGLPREDVGDAYRGFPSAQSSGFRFAKMLDDLSTGSHDVRVVIRNSFGDIQESSHSISVGHPKPPPVSTQIQLRVESPAIDEDQAIQPITERLTIQGWALARSGIAGIDVLLDDERIGEAYHGLSRQDVGIAFPDWANSYYSGYAFYCPQRYLRDGQHTVQINVRAQSGEILEYRFGIWVERLSEGNHQSFIRRRVTQAEADVNAGVLDVLGHQPSFHLVIHQDLAAELDDLRKTLESLSRQVYDKWSVQLLCTETESALSARESLAELAADIGERIDVVGPIADDAADVPLGGLIAGEGWHFVGFLSPGDELGCDALQEFAIASGLYREADLLYADEARISPISRELEPFYKPDFSPDLLLSTNYIGRPWFASMALLQRAKLTSRDLAEIGEYDAVLRCSEVAVQIRHLPKLLCQRGPEQIDAEANELLAVRRALQRREVDAQVLPGRVPGTWRSRRPLLRPALVSIIIQASGKRGQIETCIKSLRRSTGYQPTEIICVDHIPDDQVARKKWLRRKASKVVSATDNHWSRSNNQVVHECRGEFLLFLDEDAEAVQSDWLAALVEHAQRNEVAVVGPQLLSPDGRVKQAGIFLTTEGLIRSAFHLEAADERGYFGLAQMQRNVIAVTGNCMLMRRAVFDELGGFDETYRANYADVDLCLRAHQVGRTSIFTPFSSLVHHAPPGQERQSVPADFECFKSRWRAVLAAGDPYFNPCLSSHLDNYQPDDEPVQTIFSGHPLFRLSDIRRILIVKVDHIGDFVTALPAIQRLRRIFPQATIHMLAAPATCAIAEALDCVDGCIEFEFFHPISDLGRRKVNEVDYLALRDRLEPYRFDLAVDLRKHPETREVLRHTAARFLAGYDHMGSFPFLDISLEWDGDRHLARKRSHVTDDLLNLVEAIGTAGTAERMPRDLVGAATGLPPSLDADVCALFVKPVVAVHPGGGSAMRQWPVGHFATLIDLLVERDSVNVVLIGGPEEATLTANVLERVVNRDSVRSLVGVTSFLDLRAILLECALFVGNNSGPKHIAAALGVPTVGIHSGVVDAREWGPIGPHAVAMQRNMACSPCYLLRPEDCPRGFSCMRGLEPRIVHQVSQVLLARPVLSGSQQPFDDGHLSETSR